MSGVLVYDPATHTSRLADGTPVPHVTAVLSAVGISTDFEQLAALGPRYLQAIEHARHLGSAVHKDAHAYDDGDLDWASVDPRVLPYLEAWATFRATKHVTPVARERLLYHPTYQYAGIMDGLFTTPSVRRVLLDIKSGGVDVAGRFQTAAYEGAYLAAYPEETVDERWVVQLTPGRRIPYRIWNCTAEPESWNDFHTFIAFLTTYRWQKRAREMETDAHAR